jgi:cellulose synthase/poly-beta-1,6-N-acetylglucosamine synthase-like glycosyltransferase
MFEVIFWFSVFMIIYAYIGYPLCLMAILALRKVKSIFVFKVRQKSTPSDNSLMTSHELPFVSFIITAFNEENRIEEKINNSLSQDYPKNKLELIVASDCSSDKTDDIVENFVGQGVKLVRAPERKGKENAQKYAVDASNGEILVFSDVATILKSQAIKNIVKNFTDPTIGCVSSLDKFIDKDDNVSGEGAYVKYEMFLRILETRVNTLVGLSGSFFAARRSVCKNWAIDLQSDFNTLLNSIKKGLRGISDPNSIGYYQNIADEKKEYQRKVRTVLRGISVLMRNLSLLNAREYGLFSWQLFSHKLCRWMVPYFMILSLLSNILVVINHGSLILMLILQILFYAIAYYYYCTEIRKNKLLISVKKNNLRIHCLIMPVSKLFYFFISVNFSILVAWLKFLKGERATFWEPSKR